MGKLGSAYIVENCPKKNHTREHIEVHVSGLQYTCPDCGANFKSKNAMRRHISKACTRKDGMKCKFCHFKSYSQSLLVSHINSKHASYSTNQKPLEQTPVYGFFGDKISDSALERGLSPFKCVCCDFLAYDRAQLSHHMTTKHEDAETIDIEGITYFVKN